MEMVMRGKFITFEGSEGSGKSTQIDLVYQYLKKHGKKVLLLREPGGVKISERIRQILLDTNNKGMSDECETLLYMAARAQLVKEVILPALNQGQIILCDRFLDSTIAYQGYGNGVNIDFIKKLGLFVTGKIKPDLTIILDIDTQKGLARIHRPKDRIEQRKVSYHNRVRYGYQQLARKEPRRVKLIEVNKKSKDEIYSVIQKYIQKLLKIK